MNLPSNTDLPFFTYGIFKPGKLCFPRLKDLVKKTIKGTVDGILKERDGIPLLVKSRHSKIKGCLVVFHTDKKDTAYNRIMEIDEDEVFTITKVINGTKYREINKIEVIKLDNYLVTQTTKDTEFYPGLFEEEPDKIN